MKKILLIDDDKNIRTIARLGLEDAADWELSEASNGAAGVELALKEQPYFILLDMMMPEMDGIATLEKLRQNDSTKNIPVIFMTAKVQSQEIEQYEKLGVAGVIVKPFDPLSLEDDIRKICKNIGLE